MTDSAKAAACPIADSAPDLSPVPHTPRIALAWLIVPCLACDALMMPVLSSLGGPPRALSVAIAFGIVGCVLAQGNLLAAWLAWSEGPFLRRLRTHWKIAAGLYLVWLVGLAVAIRNSEAPTFAATVALGVPLVSLAAQLPLWVARQWLGWRLEREHPDPAHPSEPPLAIRDLMLATLVVAVSLALARLAPADGKEVWSVWAIAFAVTNVVSSLSLLPTGALLLRGPPTVIVGWAVPTKSELVGTAHPTPTPRLLRPRLLGRGLVWSGLYAGAWIALVWVVVAVQWWYAPALLAPRVIYVGLSSLMATFAATLMLTAVIARDRGYRLAARRKRLPPRST